MTPPDEFTPDQPRERSAAEPISDRELERRLTRLETTVGNFKWVMGIAFPLLGTVVVVVVRLLESSGQP